MVIYYFGDGKGKTTAALGSVLRAAGYGWQCLFLQAIKGTLATGERRACNKYLSQVVSFKSFGKGFVGFRGDKLPLSAHRNAAQSAINAALEAIEDRRHRLIVLDEYGDLPQLDPKHKKAIIKIIELAKLNEIHLIITGHKPQKNFVIAADIVSNISNVKHHYECGIMAIRGIDY